MHLRNVEIFCEVAQRRSFSKGAAAREVSQSAASQAVGLLEKRLGKYAELLPLSTLRPVLEPPPPLANLTRNPEADIHSVATPISFAS